MPNAMPPNGDTRAPLPSGPSRCPYCRGAERAVCILVSLLRSVCLAIANNKLIAARWGLLFAGLGIFLYAFATGYDVYLTYRKVEHKDIDLAVVPFNDVTKYSLDIALEQSKAEFAYVIVLIGILWGLLLLTKEAPTIQLHDVPELLLFIFANLTIVVNAICHMLYLSFMSDIASAGGKTSTAHKLVIPDFRHADVTNIAVSQRLTLLCVLALVALTVISIHKLKGSRNDAEESNRRQ